MNPLERLTQQHLLHDCSPIYCDGFVRAASFHCPFEEYHRKHTGGVRGKIAGVKAAPERKVVSSGIVCDCAKRAVASR